MKFSRSGYFGGFSKTEPWVSEPVTKERLNDALENMKAKGCTIVNVIDMGDDISFTQGEMQMLYAACMSYGDEFSHIIVRHIPYEDAGIVKNLSERALICHPEPCQSSHQHTALGKNK